MHTGYMWSRKSSGLSKGTPPSTPPSSSHSTKRPQVPFRCNSIDELLAANVGELHPTIRPWTTTTVASSDGRPPRFRPNPPAASSLAGPCEPPAAVQDDTAAQPQRMSPTKAQGPAPTPVSEVAKLRQLLRDVIPAPETEEQLDGQPTAAIDDDFDTFVSTHRNVLPESLSMQLLLAQQMAKGATSKLATAATSSSAAAMPFVVPSALPQSVPPSRGGTAASGSPAGWTPFRGGTSHSHRGAGEAPLGSAPDIEVLRGASDAALGKLLLLVLQALIEPRRSISGLLKPRSTTTPSALLDVVSTAFNAAVAKESDTAMGDSSNALRHTMAGKPATPGSPRRAGHAGRSQWLASSIPQPSAPSVLPRLPASASAARAGGEPVRSTPQLPLSMDEGRVIGTPPVGGALPSAPPGDDAYRKALLRRIDGLQQDKAYLREEVQQLRSALDEARLDLGRLSERYFQGIRDK